MDTVQVNQIIAVEDNRARLRMRVCAVSHGTEDDDNIISNDGSCAGCLFLNMYDSRPCVIIDCEVRNEKSSGIGHDSVHSVYGNGNGASDSRIA